MPKQGYSQIMWLSHNEVMKKKRWPLPDVIAIGLMPSGRELFSDECTIQQFVPCHMHIRRPLGKLLTRNVL